MLKRGSDSGSSGECSSQVTIEPTSSKLKPYPYQGKKYDPNFFNFSQESIAEHEASKINQEKSANDRNCFFKKNDSDSQNETKKQKGLFCRLFCCCW